MTTVETPRVELRPVVHDIYRDIHKGIRAVLFDVTGRAGSTDPADRDGRVALAASIDDLADLLVSHAEHEDGYVQPVLERELPALADKITTDHHAIEARIADLRTWAEQAVDAPRSEERFALHRLYLELASFTSAYLEHQDVEERLVMPTLEEVAGVDAVVEIHETLVASIPPDEMAAALAVMLPAMNVDDRSELLGGIRANAPAEAFQGVWGLATSVLAPADLGAAAARLGLS